MFIVSGALDDLPMKKEDVLKFLAAGTHLGVTNLDYQMEQYICERKSDGITSYTYREPGRTLPWRLALLLPLVTRVTSVSYPPGILASELCRSLLLPLLLLAASLLGTSLTLSRPPSWSRDFRRLLIQVWSQSRLMLTRLPSLCHSDSSLRCVDIAIPSNNRGAPAVGLRWWMWARGWGWGWRPAHVWHQLPWASGWGHPAVYSAEMLKMLKS